MEDLRSISSAANGAKSQGSSTPEGKAQSARNAETHGIHAKAVVLRSESAEAYAALRDSFAQQFQLRTPLESELIDQLAASAWRLRRFTGMETAALDHAIIASSAQVDTKYSNIDPETRAYFAFDQLAQANSTLGILSRAQAAIEPV